MFVSFCIDGQYSKKVEISKVYEKIKNLIDKIKRENIFSSKYINTIMLLLPLMAPDNSVSDDYVNFDANADFDNSILDAINDDMINIIEKVFINTNELDISMVSRKILEDFLAPLRQFSTNISDDIEKYLKASKKIKARQMLKEKSKQLTRP